MVFLSSIITETKPIWKGRGKRGWSSHSTAFSIKLKHSQIPSLGSYLFKPETSFLPFTPEKPATSLCQPYLRGAAGAHSHCEWQPL